VSCGNDPKLLDRVRPWAGLVRADHAGIPVVIEPGSVYVTKGSDRRSTGTHYTPPSLTEPIVRYTLEPLVYEGPAQGKPEEEWVLRPAREILGLKVCDMACGSGAFLVQACRYLSERLVEAWARAEAQTPGKVVVTPEGELSEARPSECIIPKDPAERLAVARRIVADRCLFGVDVNPMAVEMAKLSLWLVTLQMGRPFNFLDHAVKCGDSLLGVTDVRQIEDFTLTPGQKPGHLFLAEACRTALRRAEASRRQLEDFSVLDIRDAIEKERLLKEADEAVNAVQVVGDLLLGLELVQTKSRRDERRPARDEIERLVQEGFDGRATTEKRRGCLERLAEITRNLLTTPHNSERRPFHWPLELPEVFAGDDTLRGFHALVGNPPFQGGQKITGTLGTDYRDHLIQYVAGGRRGSADLCAYFFLRAGALLRPGGGAGLLATNTIAQGDTREVGLEGLVAQGFSIPRAVSSRAWPGQANLEVAHVWIRKGPWSGPHILDEQSVRDIGPFLAVPGRATGKPYRLAANADKSFQGSIVLGMGFVLTPEEAQRLIKKDRRNREVLFPYLNGEDLNSRPDQSASRWVISFRDWPLDRKSCPGGYKGPVAADYPDCLAILEERVKPERQRKRPDGSYVLRKPLPQRWWHYAEKRPALYSIVAKMKRVLPISSVAKHPAFAFVPADIVFDHNLTVVTLDRWEDFAVLQSNLHLSWASAHSSTLETRIGYRPSDAFETYPFPNRLDAIGRIGDVYHGDRKLIMLNRAEGLTKTYNRFHDRREKAQDIERLRAMQVDLDTAVAQAYSWTDLALGHDFLEMRQGLRFTISESARREVLDRLLELNHTRYKEEVDTRLDGSSGGAGGTKRRRRGNVSESGDV
jgi:hypothetical protein